MDGRLEPGAAVSIDGMARELDVSPTPVREALARLEHTGMVRRVALKGYRVAPVFTREDFAELMEARLAIEPVNARLGLHAADPRAGSRNSNRLSATSNRRREARRLLSTRITWKPMNASTSSSRTDRNQFLLAAYAALGGQVQRFRLFGGVGITDAEYAIAEHQSVLDAFSTGDPDKAEAAMEDHVQKVRARAIADAPED